MLRKRKKQTTGFYGRNALERDRLANPYEEVPLRVLRPWANNPRRNHAAVPKVAALIKQHGFAGVIVATPDGIIRAGHTRFAALQLLGYETVRVHWKNFPSEEAAEDYALADNKSNEFAEWDQEKLGKYFEKRKDVDVGELSKATGFEQKEIKFAKEDENEAFPFIEKEIISQTGNIWMLGSHRLICGDNIPKQVDDLLKFWMEFTNKEPILEATGQTFSEVRRARSSKPRRRRRK